MSQIIKPGDTFYLQWDVHRLYGWERKKDKKKVASILEAILQKDKIPRVLVHQHTRRKDVFFISDDEQIRITPEGFRIVEAGHHRALAHYLLNVPLKCELAWAKMRKHHTRNYSIDQLKVEDYSTTELIKPYRPANIPVLESAIEYQDLIHQKAA